MATGGQIFGSNAAGGYSYQNQLSNDLRIVAQTSCKFRQFADGAQIFGQHRGNTFTWAIIDDSALPPGAALNETQTMPVAGYVWVAGTGTTTEYGLSVPWTELLEDYGKFSITHPTHRVLKNHCVKTLDRLAWVQMKATQVHFIASSGTDTASLTFFTNGTVTGTNSVGFHLNHLKTLSDNMKANNVPPYLGEDYYSIGRPAALRVLKNDLESVYQYTESGMSLVFRGEIGRRENVRFVEQTNIAAGIGTTGVSTATAGGDMKPWTNGQSDWLFFFGEDTIYEGIVVPEHVRAKVPDDYGRSRGLAWYYNGGFAIINGANLTNPLVNTRIYMWDSQA